MLNDEKFIINGFIIKSYEEIYENEVEGYNGIGRYITWPLDICTDAVSKQLNEEALCKWLGYQDDRLQVIPDADYIVRYVEHCNELGIPTFCLQIESNCDLIVSNEPAAEKILLGYDYVDAGMQISCLYDDLALGIQCECLSNIRAYVAKEGLIPTMDIMKKYLRCRENIKLEDAEEYYFPRVVKVSRVVQF